MKLNEKKIIELHNEVKKNPKILENLPVIKEILIILLKIAKIFTNDKIDRIIDEIIIILTEK